VNLSDLKKAYGQEYPAAITDKGTRIPLAMETRFTRLYALRGKMQHHHYFSRFMDGSATMSFEQLKSEWPKWTETERLDFCGSSCWLYQQSDFPEMLRFIVKDAGCDEMSAIALSISGHLPQDEAYQILFRALRLAPVGRACNFSQAIAHTKHPEAEATIRHHLRAVSAHPALWDDDKFSNSIAFEATCCVEHLLELGAPPSDFEAQVRQLSKHTCSHNRRTCRNFLGKYYPWLQ